VNHPGKLRSNVARCYESVSLIQSWVPRIPQRRVNWSVGISSMMEVVKSVCRDLSSHSGIGGHPTVKLGSGKLHFSAVSLLNHFWLLLVFSKFSKWHPPVQLPRVRRQIIARFNAIAEGARDDWLGYEWKRTSKIYIRSIKYITNELIIAETVYFVIDTSTISFEFMNRGDPLSSRPAYEIPILRNLLYLSPKNDRCLCNCAVSFCNEVIFS
jgi:hypothetical protein